MAWVPAHQRGFRAARFHPVVARPRRRRPEQHRRPAGDRHHQRSLWPDPGEAGSCRRDRPFEQSPSAGDRETGRAFVVRLAGAARAAHGPAFNIDARGSAGFRGVAGQLAACAVPVPVCASANRGLLRAGYEPGFHTAVNYTAVIIVAAAAYEPGFLHAAAVGHAAVVHGDAYGAGFLHGTVHAAAVGPGIVHAGIIHGTVRAVVHGAGFLHGTVHAGIVHGTVHSVVVHGDAFGAGFLYAAVVHGTVAGPGAVHAGPELTSAAGALRRDRTGGSDAVLNGRSARSPTAGAWAPAASGTRRQLKIRTPRLAQRRCRARCSRVSCRTRVSRSCTSASCSSVRSRRSSCSARRCSFPPVPPDGVTFPVPVSSK